MLSFTFVFLSSVGLRWRVVPDSGVTCDICSSLRLDSQCQFATLITVTEKLEKLKLKTDWELQKYQDCDYSCSPLRLGSPLRSKSTSPVVTFLLHDVGTRHDPLYRSLSTAIIFRLKRMTSTTSLLYISLPLDLPDINTNSDDRVSPSIFLIFRRRSRSHSSHRLSLHCFRAILHFLRSSSRFACLEKVSTYSCHLHVSCPCLRRFRLRRLSSKWPEPSPHELLSKEQGNVSVSPDQPRDDSQCFHQPTPVSYLILDFSSDHKSLVIPWAPIHLTWSSRSRKTLTPWS